MSLVELYFHDVLVFYLQYKVHCEVDKHFSFKLLFHDLMENIFYDMYIILICFTMTAENAIGLLGQNPQEYFFLILVLHVSIVI